LLIFARKNALKNAKKILVDLSMLKNLYTGLGQFSLFLGKELLNQSPDNFQFDFLLPKNRFELFANYAHLQDTYWLRRHGIDLIRQFLYPQYDLWHITSQHSRYFPFFGKTPIIYTIHDLNFLDEKHPEFARKKLNEIQHRIDKAQIVTAISKYTAQVVSNNLDLKNKKIEVIYNGVEVKAFENAKRPQFVDNQPFIFSISTLMEKKNFHSLLPFIEQVPDYQLIIAGRKPAEYTQKLENEIGKRNLENRVILAGEVTDEEKYWLYQNCEAFVFPSKLEGFGLPVIEAMRLGKPVFCSDLTSLPEVGGEEAYYWRSFEPEAMKEVFLKGMADFKNSPAKAQSLKQYSQKFTWQRAVEQYLEIYKMATNL
jgi:glycosyltransferase involved in cell wall biosynthesis